MPHPHPSVASRARRGRRRLALVGVVLTTVVLPATAAAVTPSEAVGFLSAQRVANGLPGLTESPAANVGCANHNAYMRQNGNALAHGETPGNPGYTPEGASTGGAEVLARGGSGAWDAAWANPWSDAPVHALLMFSPTYAQAGYADSDGFQCMRITTSVAAPGATYSVPGPGATGVPTAIDARGEGPYSPADVAGVDDANTGFNVIVYRPGTSVEIASATLVPAGGTAVDTRIVDNRTTVPGGGSWPWRGGVIVPVAPLSPATTYALDVTFVDGATHHADFTTAGAPAGGAGAGGAGGAGGVGGPGGAGTGTGGTTRRGTYVLRVAKASRRGAKLRLALTASGASVGRKATVRRERRVRTCTRAGRCTVRWRASGPRSTITLKRSQTLAVPRPARGVTMRLSVSVAAATVGDVRYPARTARRTYRR